MLTAQLRETRDIGDFAASTSQQEAVLEQAYGDVTTTPLSEPGSGVSFHWHAAGMDQALIAFERPGSVAVFTFGGSPAAAHDWEKIVTSFTDQQS